MNKSKSISDRVRKELNILDSAGKLTPAEVVIRARNPLSPMHKFFNWNDSIAARMYREDQARKLISDFTVTVKVNKYEIQVQEFVHVSNGDNEQGYKSFHKVVADKELAKTFMMEQLQIAHGHVYKVLGYAKALGFEDDVSELSKSIDKIYAKVQAAAA